YTVISYEEAHSYAFSRHTLLIQGTPVGMFPRFREVPPFPIHRIAQGWRVWELIYNPNPTRFIRLAHQRNASVESGLHLFRRQAEHSLRLWSEAWSQAYKPVLRQRSRVA
ncbi:MAG: hypothetical protein NZ580_08070, partial [Bacteroidia bacterium]|nr:hypothetical protein [Bacteroidia bacterium]MDW8236703.1 hypothetical protein [Bacteroidia bacterium]